MRLSKIIYSSKRAFVNVGCYCFDSIVFLFIVGKKAFSSRKNILLIKPDAIGDFIVWSNSAKAYKTLYPAPEFKIYLLGNPICEELALKSGYIDEFIAFDRIKFMLNWLYRYKCWQNLLAIPFDTIIYPSYSQEFASGNLLVSKLSASHKLGINSDYAIDTSFWINLSKKHFTRLLELPKTNLHELLKNEAFVRALGLSSFTASLPDLSYCSIQFGSSNHKLSQISNQKYFIIAPGARIGLRQWSPKNFSKIADFVSEKTGWQGILIGSKSEQELCQIVSSNSNVSLINLAGDTSLVEMINLIGKSQLFIGNETSGIHIAIAQKCPSVCILGGGHFGRFMPYPLEILLKNNVQSLFVSESMTCFNCDWNCIYRIGKNETVPCIEKIKIETVMLTLTDIIDQIKTSKN